MIVGDLLLASVKIDALSDTELLNLSREGDGAAFGVLWERHRLAGVVAARNIAETLDPDDLVSGAYLKILELVRDGRGPTGAFRPYLYKVISSLAADTYRSPEHSDFELTEVPDLTEAGPWEDGAFDLNAAARAFESLPERWQTALWYSEVEGLAPRQIAPILGMTANGVSALSARAKEGLQSAWVESHINMQLADEACGTTRSRLQRFQLGKLTSRRSREVAEHLEACDSCAAAASECRTLNKQLALVLLTILLGGAPAAALLKSLGAGAASAGAAAGAGAGAATAIATAAGSSQSSGAAGSATGISSGGAAAGAGAGLSVGVIALVATAALAVAAVGGIVLVNNLGSGSPNAPSAGASDVESEHESSSSAKPEEPDKSDASDSQAQDPADSLTDRSLVAAPARDADSKDPRPPHQTSPPKLPPTVPATLLAGYQCYIPHVDTGEFEITGRASAPANIRLVLRSNASVAAFNFSVGANNNWSSGRVAGPLSDLSDFVNGTITADVSLQSGATSSMWETVTVTQCVGTGPTVDTNLRVSEVCVLDPIATTLYGRLSEYGVIFARMVAGGSVTTISDPALDGTIDPTDPSVIWSGILTGSDVSAPHFWWAPLALAPYLGTAADYNAGTSGRLELRVETPDERTSTWMHIDELVEVGSCPF